MKDQPPASTMTLPGEPDVNFLRRWRVALLVSAAIAISYLDRQTLPWAIQAIQADIPFGYQIKADLDSAFLVTYGLMYLGGGLLLDRLGTRRGFLVIMIFWSLACASHGLAGGVLASDCCSSGGRQNPRRMHRSPRSWITSSWVRRALGGSLRARWFRDIDWNGGINYDSNGNQETCGLSRG